MTVIEFNDLLKKYKVNEYVYPRMFMEKLNIDVNECYILFSYFVHLGTLEQIYIVKCESCRNETYFDHFNEMENCVYCEHCENKIYDEEEPLKNAELIYKTNYQWEDNEWC